MLRVSFNGLGLFADEGKHKGAALGYLYGTSLQLYGATNFKKYGGLSWQHGRHVRFEVDPEIVKGLAVWVEAERKPRRKHRR